MTGHVHIPHQVTPLACCDLKETQSMGKQDPYVKIVFGLDCGRVWSTCPSVPFRDVRFAGVSFRYGPLLEVQTWKGPVVEDGGSNPVWSAEDPKNTADFMYLPGVEFLRLEIWNSNMMSDNYIARAWVPLADAFTCTRKPGQFSYKLFRDSGKNYGTVSLQFSWAPPRGVPVSACVPLTIQVKSRADPSGKFINSFMLYDCTIPECIARAQTKTPEKEAEYLMATMPTMMSRFGAHSIAFLRKSGGIAVSQCDREALIAGLWPHDIIIGFAQDKALPEDQRGHNALISGAAKWAKLNDSSRAKALADLQPFVSQGSVTLTVLRAMPFQFIPGDHALKLAFVIPPLSVEFEPNDLAVIAGDRLPTVQAAVKPAEGRPYWFKAAASLPEGLELDARTGQVAGLPSVPGKYEVPITAWNACGEANVSLRIHVMAAPTALVYTRGHKLCLALSVPMTPHTIEKIDGTGPFSFSASRLPPGLFIDDSSGEITGTPSDIITGCVMTVTASGPAGAVHAELIIEVQRAPSKFAYAVSAPALRRSEQVTVHASVDGSHPLVFESEPPLPQGLVIDNATGNIFGTPVNSDSGAIYTITASNVAGKVSTSFQLQIMDPPTSLEYAHGVRGQKLVYNVGCEIMENNVVSVAGSRPVVFSADPALPAGINLDPHTGTISGIPVCTTESLMYIVTAKNGVGEAVAPLLIQIDPHAEEQEDLSQADVEVANISDISSMQESSEVKDFLVFCGCPQYADAFINDGWEDIDSIFTMNEMDLKDIGVIAADISRIMSKFPSADKKHSDAAQLQALLRRADCEEYAALLEQKHIASVPELCVFSEEQLVGFGLKKGHARKLYNEAIKITSAPPATAPVATVFSSIRKSDALPDSEPCGVGLQLGKFGRFWGVAGVVPGGAADQEGSITKGDLIVAIDSGDRQLSVTKDTSLEQIAVATKGPRGSPITLVLKRRGTVFGINLVRMPVFKQERPPEAKITLRVVSAQNLPPMDTNGLCDPYVMLHCNHQVKSTHTCWKTRHAQWNSDHFFLCDRGSRMIVSVWDKDRFTSKFTCKMGDLVDFDTGQILKEDIACTLRGADGQPVLCELGLA